MTTSQILKEIKAAMISSPRNGYIAELHLQVIKYAEELKDITGKEFCEHLGIGPAFGTEFLKMKKIAPRLRAAGLDPQKI